MIIETFSGIQEFLESQPSERKSLGIGYLLEKRYTSFVRDAIELTGQYGHNPRQYSDLDSLIGSIGAGETNLCVSGILVPYKRSPHDFLKRVLHLSGALNLSDAKGIIVSGCVDQDTIDLGIKSGLPWFKEPLIETTTFYESLQEAIRRVSFPDAQLKMRYVGK
jgi:hypothetical protein